MQLAHQAEVHPHAVRRLDGGALGFDQGDFRGSVLAGTRCAPQAWSVSDLQALSDTDIAALVETWQPTVILLGTGIRQRFPAPRVLLPALRAGIGVEVMDTRAAARTYNVLLAESREVLLAVLAD